MIVFPIFQYKDDIWYKYIVYLIDLGAKPYLYDWVKEVGNLQGLLHNLVKYIFIVLAILLLFPIFRWAFYGGFSNIVHIWIVLLISIFFNLVTLAFMVLSILTFAYNLINMLLFMYVLPFECNLIFPKLYIFNILYFFMFIFTLCLFLYSFGFSLYINSVRKETKKLENEELGSEDVFKVKTLDNGNFILEAVNSDNIPKNLFYSKKNDDNPISNISQSECLFLEQNLEELLSKKEQMNLKNFKTNIKNGLSGNIFSIIIKNIFSIAFIIIALSISIKNNKYYQIFRNYLIKHYKSITYKDIYSDSDVKMNGFPSFTQLWCDFANVENEVIITYLIFIILHICFQIIQYFIHIDVIKLDFKKGISYNAMILINSLFYIIFMIYFPFLLYIFFYSIIILAISPFDADSEILSFFDIHRTDNQYHNLWGKRKIIPGINIVFKFLIFIFNAILSANVKTLIMNYLNLNFKEGREEKYEKNTSVLIDNNTYNVKIIANEILYLKQIDSGTIHKFKQISIETITDGYVYVKLGHNSITDQISLSEWHYPESNYIFSQLATLCELIYGILFISIPLFKCLIKEEFFYILYIFPYKVIKTLKYNKDVDTPKFNSIFISYGDFEYGVIKSRFFLYIISLFFLLSCLLKRIYNSGFKTEFNSMVSFIASLIFISLNSTYLIINFLMVLFEIFSIICAFDLKFGDDILFAELFIQLFLNIIIFFISIKILADSIKLSINLNDLRKQFIKFTKVEEISDSLNFNEFRYMTIEGNVCQLKEVRNEKLQRYLYYSLNNNEYNDKYNVNSEVLNINKAVTVQNEDLLKKDNLAAETHDRINV